MDVKMLDFFEFAHTTNLQERAKRFVEDWVPENRHVIAEFERIIRQLKSRGRKTYGGQAIQEYLRFNSEIGERGSEFKLNNNSVALLTRFIMYRDSAYDGFFQVRTIGDLPEEKARPIIISAMRSAGELS